MEEDEPSNNFKILSCKWSIQEANAKLKRTNYYPAEIKSDIDNIIKKLTEIEKKL